MERALCPVLIGREGELSELEDALLAANRGEGQVVVLAGDAGIGKTRLATELQRRARRLGMNVLWGGCSEAELALPYLPFLEAIGNYLAGADIEDLRDKLGPVRRELAHLFPQLEPDGVAPDVDSTQGRLRLYEAVLALLELASREQGLLLLIEDLHWSDSSTRELLDYLTRRLRTARIMVLATHRSDEMHRRHPLLPLIQGWRRSSSATIVELPPLTPEKVAEMVVAIFDLGDEGVQDDTRSFLHERTEGNPFVLEEMLKAALDRGDIFRNEAGWTRKALKDFKIPESVRDTILLRLDRLSSDQLDILRSAAVLGNSFSYDTLVVVSGHGESEVRAAVEACVLQQLLTDDPRLKSGYRFRHALTREAIYDDIITPVRESLHGAAADALRAKGGSPIEISQQMLAAGRTAEVVPLCLEAAAQAELEYAHADAAALYERILPHLADEQQRAEVLCRLGVAYHSAGQPTAGHGNLQAGIELLDRLGRSREAAHFRIVFGRCAWEAGKSSEALLALERARDELEPAGPSADLALVYVRLASMRIFNLDGAGCVHWARRAIMIGEAAGALDVLVQARLYLGDGLATSGHLDEGLEILDSSFHDAIERGLYSVAVAAFNNASSDRTMGYRAVEVLDRMHLLDRVPDSVGKSVVAGMSEGLAAYALGDLERAAHAFDAVRQVAREAGFPVWSLRGRSWLADCLSGLGRVTDANAVSPALDEFVDVEDILDLHVRRIRHALAAGDSAAAVEGAGLIFESEATLEPNSRSRLAFWCSLAFVTADNMAMAERAARIGLGDGLNVPPPARSFLEAALALTAGDRQEAVVRLRSGLQFLDGVGYNSDGCPFRRHLADLLLQLDQPNLARVELQKVFDVASRLGMVVERRLAADELRKLGVTVADDEAPVAPTMPRAAGERYVTVLFVDVRGYTAMSHEKTPAEMTDTVATLQRWAGATVEKQLGMVDKFAGDAVMATFNVSGAHVDHAQHALSCALAIRDKAGALGLPVGAGIATGPAVVGGLSAGANVSVVGETTNLASRLQAEAGGGEIVLSAEAHRRVRDWLAGHGYQPTIEKLELKGVEEPVEAWRIRSPAGAKG